MTLNRELPLVIWPVSCFDRRRENPLPVYNRWHWLDWSQLTAEQTAEIITAINAKRRTESPYKPTSLEGTVATMTIGCAGYDTHMLKYRHLFSEVPHNDIAVLCRDFEWRETISVVLEYFEDETGTQMSKYEMMQHVTGQLCPILIGDPQSVMKLGPTSSTNAGAWNTTKANTIGQLLDVVQRIRASEWYRTPRAMTVAAHRSAGARLLEARFPGDEETLAVLPYFRQLHAKDKLVVTACDYYMEHVSDDRKRWWVKERKESFVSLVDSPPDLARTSRWTRRQVIRMFAYGARLLHSESSEGDDVALDAFVAEQGKHQAVMVFNSCLMDLLRVAATIQLVIQQDFAHWLAVDGLAAPTRVDIQSLFEGFSSPGGE